MRIILTALLWFIPLTVAAQDIRISDTAVRGGIDLKAASIHYAAEDAAVVAFAAEDLSEDIERVTGTKPALNTATPQQVWVGTLGQNPQIDALIARRKIDAKALKNCWECFLIVTVDKPAPGVDTALVIVGSDRRGTAFGVYTLSEAIGVSPWYWWADVTPQTHDTLYLVPVKAKFGPPSVKYRGMFINDEDWGLLPWAMANDPSGNMGPATYEKVFELTLRLKGNLLWPAMHKVSKPFNADPANAQLADRYAIVMGSSHAEPMLRNNVGEWTEAGDRFNYAINSEGVAAYWRERLKTNGRYENLYTLGMRGIHDSGIVGAETREEKTALLNRIIADQRKMIAEEVGDPQKVPQVFVPYKEVLDIYRDGLNLPDDVTVVWPDDNFGYIRQFPNDAERKRSGGSGVYYHLSYLGAPLAYLWLSTIPPALVTEEMGRAYDNGARDLWVVNVGDIKPAEVSVSHFMALAWDVPGTRAQSQKQWLTGFAARTFGPETAQDIGAIWDSYFRLNFVRKPEHLQWWGSGERIRRSDWRLGDIRDRMTAFETLDASVVSVKPKVSASDGFFQLVEYPVGASAAANARVFALEAYAARFEAEPEIGMQWALKARTAHQRVGSLTEHYGAMRDGKWSGFINEEPADNLWPSFRTVPLSLPPSPTVKVQVPDWRDGARTVEVDVPVKATGWRFVQGLGRGEGSLAASPKPWPVTFEIEVPEGNWALAAHIIPTYPTDGAKVWKLTVRIDDGPEVELVFDREGQNAVWRQGVLDNRQSATTPITAGKHKVTVVRTDRDLLLDGIGLTAKP